MEINWKNLKVANFYKICRLCLANNKLEPLAEEEKSTLIKLTPWIAELETRIFFPDKICSDCAKELQHANEFINRCNTLANSFHKLIEKYKECLREDCRVPSLEAIFGIKQEVKQTEEKIPAGIPFTEVILLGDIKTEEIIEFEDTNFISQSIESTPDIPGSVEPDFVESSLEKTDIIKILKRSVNGKLVLAYFEKNKKFNAIMRQKLANSLIENLLIDNFKKIIHTAELAKLAELIAAVFPTENKEIYFRKWMRGKLYSKYNNVRQQFQIVGLIPKKSIATDTESANDQEVEHSDNESEEEASSVIPFAEVFMPEDIKGEQTMDFEEITFTPQQTTVHSIESNDESVKPTPVISESEKLIKKHESVYKTFMDWRDLNNVTSFTEDDVIAHFADLSKKCRPTSLWPRYSILKSMLNFRHNIKIEKYSKLRAFLKTKPEGIKTFTLDEINTFIEDAHDGSYLAIKVALIMGLLGSCRIHELYAMKIEHIQDVQSALVVTVPASKTKKSRIFTIAGKFYKICKKYVDDVRRFGYTPSILFLQHVGGKCFDERIDGYKFAKMGQQIAKFLALPYTYMYTGLGICYTEGLYTSTYQLIKN